MTCERWVLWPVSTSRAVPAMLPVAAMAAVVTLLLSLQPWSARHGLRSRLLESSRQISHQLSAARQVARQTGLPVVVAPDLERRSLIAFLDRDGDLQVDPGESLDTVGAGLSVQLPDGVHFLGPDALPAATDGHVLDGLTAVPASPRRVAVFEADGRVRSPGAIRIGDDRTGRPNVLEIRLWKETARVEISKLIYGGAGGRTDFVPYTMWGWEWY